MTVACADKTTYCALDLDERGDALETLHDSSNGNRVYIDYHVPESETAALVKFQGAIFVGQQKLGSFAGSKKPPEQFEIQNISRVGFQGAINVPVDGKSSARVAERASCVRMADGRCELRTSTIYKSVVRK